MKIFSGLFFILFVIFALLQLNDNQPLLWIMVYGFSAYTSATAFKNYYNPLLLTLMIGAYGLWAIFHFPGNISAWLSAEQQAKSLDMKLPFIEEARESIGLLICLLVNTVYLIKGYKGAKKVLPKYDRSTEKPFD